MEIKRIVKDVLPGSCLKVNEETTQILTLALPRTNEGTEFRLRGEKNASDKISLTLRIAKAKGSAQKIEFSFYLESDTTISIAEEMVESLNLSAEQASVIAELIHNMIVRLVPNWGGSRQQLSSGADCLDGSSLVVVNGGLPSDGDLVNSQVLEEDQEKHESIISAEITVISDAKSDNSLFEGVSEASIAKRSNSDFWLSNQDEGNREANGGGSDSSKNSTISFIDSCGDEPKDLDLSSINYLYSMSIDFGSLDSGPVFFISTLECCDYNFSIIYMYFSSEVLYIQVCLICEGKKSNNFILKNL